MDKSKIRVLKRGGFSDRKGLVDINHTIQVEKLDERTRIAILNTTIELLDHMQNRYSDIDGFVKYLYCDVLSMKSKEIPYEYNILSRERYIDFAKVYTLLDHIISDNPYEDVLTLIESIVGYFLGSFPKIQDVYNELFQRECVGYRLINGVMTDCIGEAEISEMEHALNNPFSACSKHIDKSMRLLYDRDNPDYENSIKESITAVEALCQIIAGKKTTLGNVLDLVTRKGINIHPALKIAFEK